MPTNQRSKGVMVTREVSPLFDRAEFNGTLMTAFNVNSHWATQRMMSISRPLPLFQRGTRVGNRVGNRTEGSVLGAWIAGVKLDRCQCLSKISGMESGPVQQPQRRASSSIHRRILGAVQTLIQIVCRSLEFLREP